VRDKDGEAGGAQTYRVQGFAYGGGGREIQQVEVPLDRGLN